MANVQNLIPFTSDQDREKAKINGKKGGVASQKVQAQKRTFKKAIEWLVNSDIKITKGEMYDKILCGPGNAVRTDSHAFR